MQDLINNLDVNVINNLIVKYKSVLELLNDSKNLPYHAIIINYSVNYLNGNYKEESKDWKAYSIILILKLFNKNKIENKEVIGKYIDQFLEYKNKCYKDFVSDLAIVNDEFYRDISFIIKFFNEELKLKYN
jgi:hypothetical protein